MASNPPVLNVTGLLNLLDTALTSQIQILQPCGIFDLKLKLLSDSHIDMIRFSTDFNHTATFSKLSVNTAFTTARVVVFLVVRKSVV
jgi:hypothetical protein